MWGRTRSSPTQRQARKEPYHEDLGDKCRGEQCGVLDDDVISLVLERDLELVEQAVRGLAYDHCREQLAAEPGAAAGRDILLNDCDLWGGEDGAREGWSRRCKR
jgi:hypothetical protein